METKFHPACVAFPKAKKEDRGRIRESMSAAGFDPAFPIVTVERDGVRWIVDGRNSYEMAAELGLTPSYIRKEFSHAEAWRYAINANLNRRHLTKSQRAAMAVKLLSALEAEAKERKRVLSGTRSNPGEVEIILAQPPGRKAQARDEAGALMGVSGPSVAVACRLAKADPVKFAEVEAGTVNLFQAARSLPVGPSRKSKGKRAQQQRGPVHPDDVLVALKSRGGAEKKGAGSRFPLLLSKLGEVPEPMLSYVYGLIRKNPDCVGIKEGELDWERTFPTLCPFAARRLIESGCLDPLVWLELAEKVPFVMQAESVAAAVRGQIRTPREEWLATRPRPVPPVNRLHAITGTDPEGMFIARFIEQTEKFVAACVQSGATLKTESEDQHTNRQKFLRNIALVLDVEMENPHRWFSTLRVLADEREWREGMFQV